jgi:hypothetical protein
MKQVLALSRGRKPHDGKVFLDLTQAAARALARACGEDEGTDR